MARPLATFLESLSYYRHLESPGDPTGTRSPKVHSYLTVNVAGQSYNVLSRIAPTDRDFSGRSNSIAHHVVINTVHQCEAGPAWMIKRKGFFEKSWQGEPRQLPGKVRGQKGTLTPTTFPAWSNTDHGSAWAGALADSLRNNRNACLIYAPGTNVLPLIVEAQSLLSPKERWQATFSTYVTGLSNQVNCRWQCLIDGSPEALKARKNPNHFLIDLCSALPSAPPPGPLVQAVQTGIFPTPQPSRPSFQKAFDATAPDEADAITFDRGRKRSKEPVASSSTASGPKQAPATPTLDANAPPALTPAGSGTAKTATITPGGRAATATANQAGRGYNTMILILSLIFLLIVSVGGIAIWQKDHLTAWLKDGDDGTTTPTIKQVEKFHQIGPFASNTDFKDAYDKPYPVEKEYLDSKEIDLSQRHPWGNNKDPLTWKATKHADGKLHEKGLGNKENSATYLYKTIDVKKTDGKWTFSLGHDDAIKFWIDGKEEYKKEQESPATKDQKKLVPKLEPGRHTILMKVVNKSGPSGYYFAITTELETLLKTAKAEPSEAAWNAVLKLDSNNREAKAGLAALKTKKSNDAKAATLAKAREERDYATILRHNPADQDALKWQRDAEKKRLAAAHQKLTPINVPHFTDTEPHDLALKLNGTSTGVIISKPESNRLKVTEKWQILRDNKDVIATLSDATNSSGEPTLQFQWGLKATKDSANELQSYKFIARGQNNQSIEGRIVYGEKPEPLLVTTFKWNNDREITLPNDENPKTLATITFNTPPIPKNYADIPKQLKLLILQRKPDRDKLGSLEITPSESPDNALPTWSVKQLKGTKTVATLLLKAQSDKKKLDLQIKLDPAPTTNAPLRMSVLKATISELPKQPNSKLPKQPELVSFFPRPRQDKPYYYFSNKLTPRKPTKTNDPKKAPPINLPFDPTGTDARLSLQITEPTLDAKTTAVTTQGKVQKSNDTVTIPKTALVKGTFQFTLLRPKKKDEDTQVYSLRQKLAKVIVSDTVHASLHFEPNPSNKSWQLQLSVGYQAKKDPTKLICPQAVPSNLKNLYPSGPKLRFVDSLYQNAKGNPGIEMDVHLSLTTTFSTHDGQKQEQVEILKAGSP